MQIKIRGWHVKQKRMFSAEEMAADQLTLLPTGKFINVSGSFTQMSTIYDPEKFIPMLWTGLYDSNGTEIYVGDIIKTACDTSVVLFGEYENAECSTDFEGGYADEQCSGIGFFAQGNGETVWLGKAVNRFEYKILGNIYENPKLLEVTDG